MTDLLSEELVDQVEPVPEPVPEPVIESKPTKVDGRKKERTPAQLEAFQRAREAYLKKRGEINQVKKENKLTFKQWLKKSSYVEPDETTYCWLEDCWNAAQENK